VTQPDPPRGPATTQWTAEPRDAGGTVAAMLRARTGEAWSRVKSWIERGKVTVDGAVVTAVDHRLVAGAVVALTPAARRPPDPTREAVIVHDDPHVIVIDKPAGVSSVPFEAREQGTAMDLIRGAWRRLGKQATATPLHVVHRLDRATSGLLMFAKSKRAEVGLAAQLRAHTCERSYLCVAHGAVVPGRIESRLVVDRGDGLRGSARFPNQGKRAVTHVAVVEALRGATLCEVTLETGKTHQIRIHLAERGHPLVGEPVYIRDYRGTPIAASRLALHAATLGFAHPITGAPLRFSAPPPPDFVAIVERLRG
jgi:23S rRNA pseudouridine1911/1915/1917 synthase